MRLGIMALAAFAIGCSGADRDQPAPAAKPSIVGTWSDGSVVFQFNEGGTCVLMGPRFNISGSYALSDANLTITNVKPQYSAPGFVKIDEPVVHLQAKLEQDLEVFDTSERFVETRAILKRLRTDEAREAIGRISKSHREAVRAAAKPPRPDKPR